MPTYQMRRAFLVLLSTAVVSAILMAPGLAGSVRPIQPTSGDLTGDWVLNRELSRGGPPGAMPDDPGGMRGRPGGGPGGPGGRGGMGRGGGMRPPGGFGGPGQRPSEEEMKRQRELMREVMEEPTRLTLIQDAETFIFTDSDGIVRKYVANDKSEKHQLLAGTVETKARWEQGTLVIETKLNDRMTVTRSYALEADTHRLLVTTKMEGLGEGRTSVYEPGRSQ